MVSNWYPSSCLRTALERSRELKAMETDKFYQHENNETVIFSPSSAERVGKYIIYTGAWYTSNFTFLLADKIVVRESELGKWKIVSVELAE